MKEDLMRIKTVIGRRPFRSYSSLKTNQIVSQLKELDEKVEELKDILKPRTEASPVKEKRKREIISILSKRKKIDSRTLSEQIDLSRTRCNEYLKELERDGILKSITVGRKKIYRIEEI